MLGYDLWQLVQRRSRGSSSTPPSAPSRRCWPPASPPGALWQQRGGALPALVRGHSLGEFTALVCAGALEFAAAVELVRFRGELMQEAVPAGSGAMAAMLGLDDAAVEAACREAAQGEVVEPVNFNSPGQVVIAGDAAAVQRAIEAAKARGAKRAVLLPVSVPSHSQPDAGGRRAAAANAWQRSRCARRTIRYVSAVDARRARATRRTSARCWCASWQARCAGRRPCARSQPPASRS